MHTKIYARRVRETAAARAHRTRQTKRNETKRAAVAVGKGARIRRRVSDLTRRNEPPCGMAGAGGDGGRERRRGRGAGRAPTRTERHGRHRGRGRRTCATKPRPLRPPRGACQRVNQPTKTPHERKPTICRSCSRSTRGAGTDAGTATDTATDTDTDTRTQEGRQRYQQTDYAATDLPHPRYALGGGGGFDTVAGAEGGISNARRTAEGGNDFIADGWGGGG